MADPTAREAIEYLLNAFEHASQSTKPAENGYGQKRAALLAAIKELRRDADRLDAMQKRRIALIPEYEGPWDAQVYDDDGVPSCVASGTTPREAIDAALSREAPHG